MSEMIGDIPLSQVKHARFITRVGDIFTILRIIKNGLVYDITSTASSGSVSVGGNYLSWVFTAPDDRFDFDALGSGTVGQLLDGIMASIPYCRRKPEYEPDLILKGLEIIYYKNQKRRK